MKAQKFIDAKVSKTELAEIIASFVKSARSILPGQYTVHFGFNDYSYASYAPHMNEITVYDRYNHIIAGFHTS